MVRIWNNVGAVPFQVIKYINIKVNIVKVQEILSDNRSLSKLTMYRVSTIIKQVIYCLVDLTTYKRLLMISHGHL